MITHCKIISTLSAGVHDTVTTADRCADHRAKSVTVRVRTNNSKYRVKFSNLAEPFDRRKISGSDL